MELTYKSIIKYLENLKNTWRLNNILLHNPWIKEEIKMEIRIYFELKENNKTTYENA